VNLWVALASGVAGAVIGVPLAGLGSAVPDHGGIKFPARWWLGGAAPVTWRLTVPAVGGLVAGVVAARTGWSLALPAFMLAAVVGVALAVVDVRVRRLPYVFTVPMYAVCLACFGAESIVNGHYWPFVRSILACATTFAAFLMLALVFAGQLGLGDVVLTGWLAMSLGWLGWDRVGVGLLAELILQALVGAVSWTRRRAGGRQMLPMGPALLGRVS
jgi:leader peptidase (prepilin peptidase)/N-methyltransferase